MPPSPHPISPPLSAHGPAPHKLPPTADLAESLFDKPQSHRRAFPAPVAPAQDSNIPPPGSASNESPCCIARSPDRISPIPSEHPQAPHAPPPSPVSAARPSHTP